MFARKFKRKSGYCKAECPYPVVWKHQDQPRSAGKWEQQLEEYSREMSGRSANHSASHSKGDRRRKALMTEESIEKVATKPCTSSSSSESENLGDEKELICLYIQHDSDKDLFLMTKDEEVDSQSSSTQCESDSSYNEDLVDSVFKLMKGFKYVKNTQAKLKEENVQLLAERKYLKSIVLKKNVLGTLLCNRF
nr:uncharacterized protein LOC109163772 [Ipomoea trifida]